MSIFARVMAQLGAHNEPPPDTKQSAAAPLIAMQWQGAPHWAPRDYGMFAKQGYMQNAVVYRSVRMVAEAAASVPLRLFDGGHEVDAHPLLTLIEAPNALQCTGDFFETWYGSLLIAGNAYTEAVAVDGSLRELHVLRPDRMKVVPGPDGWPDAYEYTVAGRTVRFDQQGDGAIRPILHMSLYHPGDDHYGFSPIEAAATAIDIHNAASAWNKALLDNAARPTGALVYTSGDANLTAQQYERLKAELEASFQGTRNAGRPMLLEGGLDWKSMGFSPKDMDFIEAKHIAAREIALALGVPPMLLGIPGDNTYANFQEANRTLWRQTVVPLVARTARALSAWLGPQYGGGLQLRPDLDRIDALAGEREALWRRISGTDFLTLNEKRAAAGYGPVDGGDELLADSLPSTGE